ncbi:hypothetical protein MTYP_03125 [Methylophilaceae bacterium]|nr:hypothetical protein MTYP_03125 [Methylophilaceae bacterium]
MTYANLFTRTLLIAGFAFFMSSHAMAGDDDPVKMRTIAEAAGLISLEQAKEKALAAKPGTIIDAELDSRSWPQGWDYEFEIIDADGKEWDVDIDAKTGEVRKIKRDWL